MEFKYRNLADYLYFEKIVVKDFAQRVGCSAQTLREYMKGYVKISMPVARSIFLETGEKLPLELILKNNPTCRIRKGHPNPSKQEESSGIQQESPPVAWKEPVRNDFS